MLENVINFIISESLYLKLVVLHINHLLDEVHPVLLIHGHVPVLGCDMFRF